MNLDPHEPQRLRGDSLKLNAFTGPDQDLLMFRRGALFLSMHTDRIKRETARNLFISMYYNLMGIRDNTEAEADISSSVSVLRVHGKGARPDFGKNIFPSQNIISFHAVLPDGIVISQ